MKLMNTERSPTHQRTKDKHIVENMGVIMNVSDHYPDSQNKELRYKIHVPKQQKKMIGNK